MTNDHLNMTYEIFSELEENFSHFHVISTRKLDQVSNDMGQQVL